MSNNLPTLTQLKKLYKDGMNYAIKNESWFLPSKKDVVDYQLELADKATDLTSFLSAVSIYNWSWNSSFNSPKPIKNEDILKTTNYQFGNSPIGWYFLVGNCETIAYCITIIRCEIACSNVVKKSGIKPEDAVLWCVCGGYGTNNNWITIPYTILQMDYKKESYSTFKMEGIPDKIITKCQFGSDIPMQFYLKLDFIDDKNNKHSIDTRLIARGPPLPNAKNACLGCGAGLGSMYWSYTHPSVTLNLNNKTYKGNGWIDHQTFKTGGLNNPLANMLACIKLGISKKTPTLTWTWMYLQDEIEGKQYMISHTFDKPNLKSYFVKGYVIDIDKPVCNVYKDSVSHIGKCINKIKIEVLSATLINNSNYPTSYKITINSKKVFITKADFGSNTFINSSLQDSYEIPANLYDKNNKRIGQGFLEINGAFPKSDWIDRIIKYTNADPNKKDLLLKSTDLTPPASRVFVALLPFIVYFILCIVSIIIAIILIYRN